MNDEREERLGLLSTIAAFAMWGFLPVYWKQLQHVDALQILCHRVVWSLASVVTIAAATGRLGEILRSWRNDKALWTYGASATFLGINWFVYVWGVNAGHIVETSLGYFINPLVNVVLGVVFLGERPRRAQWCAIAIATLGVLYLTWQHGRPPLIALTLAGAFGVYGLIKKKAPLGALAGLGMEASVLLLPALAYLTFVEVRGVEAFMRVDAMSSGLLIFAGVATALPLLCFAAGVTRLSLTVVGLIQYIGPTIQFLLGVWLYREPFDAHRLVGFMFIWGALVLFSAEGYWHKRRGARGQGS